MIYLAADIANTFHVAAERERVVKHNEWRWKGRAKCGKEILAGISGSAHSYLIDCADCRERLKSEGVEL